MNVWFLFAATTLVALCAVIWVRPLRTALEDILERWRPTQHGEVRAPHSPLAVAAFFVAFVLMIVGLGGDVRRWILVVVLLTIQIPQLIGWWKSKLVLDGGDLTLVSNFGRDTPLGPVESVKQIALREQVLRTKFYLRDDKILRVDPTNFDVKPLLHLLEARGIPVVQSKTTFWKWTMRSDF